MLQNHTYIINQQCQLMIVGAREYAEKKMREHVISHEQTHKCLLRDITRFTQGDHLH